MGCLFRSKPEKGLGEAEICSSSDRLGTPRDCSVSAVFNLANMFRLAPICLKQGFMNGVSGGKRLMLMIKLLIN
jgi:hypothetical protein